VSGHGWLIDGAEAMQKIEHLEAECKRLRAGMSALADDVLEREDELRAAREDHEATTKRLRERRDENKWLREALRFADENGNCRETWDRIEAALASDTPGDTV
jgi:outer membrane murein-binding lipoprotein Lpp